MSGGIGLPHGRPAPEAGVFNLGASPMFLATSPLSFVLHSPSSSGILNSVAMSQPDATGLRILTLGASILHVAAGD